MSHTFPWGNHGDRLGGMSVRDCFAIGIAAGELASQTEEFVIKDTNSLNFASRVWLLADAMIATRNKVGSDA